MIVVLAALIGAALAGNTLTTLHGEPIDIYTHSQTIGNRGPALLQDQWLLERLQTHNRERIPERNVHARGATALGNFTLTRDMSQFTIAALFNGVGKKTPMACRWSTVIHSVGSPEYLRDPRGFALKFYTEEGNYDIVGLNFPVFFIRDGVRFPDMIRSLKPNPKSGLQEWWRIYDFFSSYTESTHMFTWLMDDVGIPRSYREVDGWGIHTFKWINAAGKTWLVRYYWKSEQGVHSIEDDDVAARNHFSFHTTDLYTNIKSGNFPRWKLNVQLIDEADQTFIDSLGFDVLDTTKEWPVSKIPLVEIGEFVFDTNVESQFLENEQIAFSPARMVTGILPSDEKMLQTRLFSYVDTQRYRLGTNNQMLPINRPRCPFRDLHIDGEMNFHDPSAGTISSTEFNYFPSANSPVRQAPARPIEAQQACGQKVRQGLVDFNNEQDFEQPRARVASWDPVRKNRFAKRIGESLRDPRMPQALVQLWLDRWTKVDAPLGRTIQAFVNAVSPSSTHTPAASASVTPSASVDPSPKVTSNSGRPNRTAAVVGVVTGIFATIIGLVIGVAIERRNAQRQAIRGKYQSRSLTHSLMRPEQ
eukprot:c25581_g1_i1.p1 GENE.c25581_g1_i1~~c25581_g1_i1.p1  ORF type:complete len:602 (+),score=123.00 c25581_g1_i1:44-1807(+)